MKSGVPLFVAALIAPSLMACGPSSEDYSGAYEGTLTATEVEGTQTYKSETPHHVYISPGASQDLLLQVRDECAVPASFGEDGAFTIAQAPCVYETTSLAINGKISGSGEVSESGALTLSYVLTGTQRRLEVTSAFEGTYTYQGERQ